jgi:integrase
MNRYYEKKVKLVRIKGGHCKDCGLHYDEKNAAVFCFHHRRLSAKQFSVGHLLSKSWERVLKEAKKCDLLCSNCHALRHSVPY